MTFNIGSQSAANISNVAGDQVIHGGQHVSAIATNREALDMLTRLSTAIGAAGLSRADHEAVAHLLNEVRGELDRGEPDRGRVANRLSRAAELLGASGALTNAGTALVEPLARLAGWLGAAGAAVLQLLP